MKSWKNPFWCNNIWVEDNLGWFLPETMNALFQINMQTGDSRLLVKFPDFKYPTIRKNPICIKYGREIWCFPDLGDCIWIYDLDDMRINKIEKSILTDAALNIRTCWKSKNFLFAVSKGLKKIIKISLREKKFLQVYDISANSEAEIKENICVKQSIYIVTSEKSVIYEFNMTTETLTRHSLPESIELINTIAFDGEDFWFSGYKKEVYIWNKNQNSVRKADSFPSDFGQYLFASKSKEIVDYQTELYNVPTFNRCINSENYIWFIPFKTNRILFVDKTTYAVKSFVIDEENEDRESLKSYRLQHKFMILYSTDNLLGLYSHKNKAILEINTKLLTYRYLNIRMSKFEVLSLLRGNVLYEIPDKCFYSALLDSPSLNESTYNNIGKKIHNSICLP